MKYMLLIYQVDKAWADATEVERQAEYARHEEYGKFLASRDAMVDGAELALSHNATTLRRQNGEVLLTDGPYAETAEQLGGYYLVEAADLDEALEFARALPADLDEVRPLVEQPG